AAAAVAGGLFRFKDQEAACLRGHQTIRHIRTFEPVVVLVPAEHTDLKLRIHSADDTDASFPRTEKLLGALQSHLAATGTRGDDFGGAGPRDTQTGKPSLEIEVGRRKPVARADEFRSSDE